MAYLEGIKVTAYRLEDGSFKQRGTALTDSSGYYIIGGLNAGTFILKFVDEGITGVRDAGTYATTYTGLVASMDEATSFSVASESTVLQSITMYTASAIDGIVSG